MTSATSTTHADIPRLDLLEATDEVGKKARLPRKTKSKVFTVPSEEDTPVQPAILEGVDWPAVEEAVGREQSNREKFTPTISIFRWWARRPHSLMGAIIDAAQEAHADAQGQDVFTLSDVFSGGGTVAVEAARRGIPAYAQDLYPWPILGLNTSLTPTKLTEFDKASKELQKHLAPRAARYQRADGKMLSHIMRVRVCSCPSCAKDLYLFPEHMVSKVSRKPDATDGFFGCQGCGHVDQRPLADESKPCPSCGLVHQSQRRNHMNKRCVHCGHEGTASEFFKGVQRWKAVLVQEVIEDDKGRLGVLLRLPEESDPVEDRLPRPSELAVSLPQGHETRRLTGVGFKTWGDLYSPRQAEFILDALNYVKGMKVGKGCRDRLAFAVIGMAEMPAYLCRWDRFHQKTFEGIANHHFAHTTFVVETNLASEIGRGTLTRRLRSARKALDWRLSNIPAQTRPKQVSPRRRKGARAPEANLRLAIGSSVKQGLPDGSINLTLTDPPYFDDVQYGELARLFHFWLSKYVDLPAYDEMQEAVPNTVRGTSADDYETAIMRCLAESKRTLKPEGSIVLTFHNRKMAAWKALANAIREAGLHVRAIAITRAENGADHSKRGGKGMLHDLVIECRPATDAPRPPTVAYAGRSQEAKELQAVGLALAEAVASNDDTCLDTLFQKKLNRRRLTRERIT